MITAGSRSRGTLLVVAASAGCLFGGTPASAVCPAGYEQREREAIAAYYNSEHQAIYQRRDQRFREALILYQSGYASAAKPIYAELYRDRAALAERIRSGDLRNSTQAERSSEAQRIGRIFRQKMSDLSESLKSEYNAELASIRDEVAEDRAVWLQMRTEELRNLNIEIQEGCRAQRKTILRTLFEGVSSLIGKPEASEQQPAVNPGDPGIRG